MEHKSQACKSECCNTLTPFRLAPSFRRIIFQLYSGGGGIDPRAFLQQQKGGDASDLMWAAKKDQTVMIFTSFNPDIDTKEKANEVAGRWVSMLINGHIELKPYPIENNMFIFIVDDGSRVPEVLRLLKKQPEFNFATIDSQNYYGDHSAMKLNPALLKAEEDRIKKRDDEIKAKQKWPKVSVDLSTSSHVTIRACA